MFKVSSFLLWYLKWGKHKKTLLKAKNAGLSVNALKSLPTLDKKQLDLLEVFTFLDKSRPNNDFGTNYIPLSELESYCNIYEISDKVSFIETIRRVDNLIIKGKDADDTQ